MTVSIKCIKQWAAASDKVYQLLEVVRMQQGERHWMRNIDTDVGMHFTLF
jgi:hypothetical protein